MDGPAHRMKRHEGLTPVLASSSGNSVPRRKSRTANSHESISQDVRHKKGVKKTSRSVFSTSDNSKTTKKDRKKDREDEQPKEKENRGKSREAIQLYQQPKTPTESTAKSTKPSKKSGKGTNQNDSVVRSVATRTYLLQDDLQEVESDACKKGAGVRRDEHTEAQNNENPQPEGAKDPRVKWANTLMRTKVKTLMKEFVKNRRFEPEGVTTNAFKNNEARNRYSDVLCLDSTRVVLQNRDNDYIHANWVTLPNNFQYICCQAPLQETSEDFWLMTLQEKCSVVVMLCDIMEVGQEKSSQYWPEKENSTVNFGQVIVRNTGVVPSGIDEVKYCQLEIEHNGQTSSVHHYRWSEWPDHSAPKSAVPVVELLKATKARCDNRPVVVHCSAGIGRTGTFVCVDYANEKFKVEPDATMLTVLKEVRSQRLQSVQSFLQYTYMHVCLLEYLAQISVIPRTGRFPAFLNEYTGYLTTYAEKIRKKRLELINE